MMKLKYIVHVLFILLILSDVSFAKDGEGPPKDKKEETIAEKKERLAELLIKLSEDHEILNNTVPANYTQGIQDAMNLFIELYPDLFRSVFSNEATEELFELQLQKVYRTDPLLNGNFFPTEDEMNTYSRAVHELMNLVDVSKDKISDPCLTLGGAPNMKVLAQRLKFSNVRVQLLESLDILRQSQDDSAMTDYVTLLVDLLIQNIKELPNYVIANFQYAYVSGIQRLSPEAFSYYVIFVQNFIELEGIGLFSMTDALQATQFPELHNLRSTLQRQMQSPAGIDVYEAKEVFIQLLNAYKQIFRLYLAMGVFSKEYVDAQIKNIDEILRRIAVVFLGGMNASAANEVKNNFQTLRSSVHALRDWVAYLVQNPGNSPHFMSNRRFLSYLTSIANFEMLYTLNLNANNPATQQDTGVPYSSSTRNNPSNSRPRNTSRNTFWFFNPSYFK